MRVLVDTHVFLWWVEGDRTLPAKARAALAERENECLISMVSAWELAIKTGLGKLKLALPVKRYVVENAAANGFRMLDILIGHVGRVDTLASHHRDPFDRLLIAQALEEDLHVVTADPIFRQYGLKRVR